MTSTKTTSYALRYIPIGGGNKWATLCNSNDINDEKMLLNYKNYCNSKIIRKVEIVEIVKTTTTIVSPQKSPD